MYLNLNSVDPESHAVYIPNPLQDHDSQLDCHKHIANYTVLLQRVSPGQPMQSIAHTVML